METMREVVILGVLAWNSYTDIRARKIGLWSVVLLGSFGFILGGISVEAAMKIAWGLLPGICMLGIFSIGEFDKTAIIERSERSELQKRKSDGGAGLFDVGYSVCDFQFVRLVFLCSQPVLFERRSLRGSFDWGYRVAPTGWGSAGSRAAESEGAGVGGVLGDE